ncbi:MAG: thioredoxin family protein [Rubripirellula sp.]|nr:thioredoxin family protein [Rubripirellula sp.]
MSAVFLVAFSSGFAVAKDRTTEELRTYAERRIANADDEQLTTFVTLLDQDADGTITDAEFERRIEVFQQVFVTVQPVPAGGGHDLPDYWLTDFEKAREKSAETGKPVLAMFSASWCGPCKMMIANVYPTDEAKQALAPFVPVYIDSEQQVDLATKNEVRAYPTFICFDTEGESLGQHVGGGGVDDFVSMLATLYNPTATDPTATDPAAADPTPTDAKPLD